MDVPAVGLGAGLADTAGTARLLCLASDDTAKTVAAVADAHGLTMSRVRTVREALLAVRGTRHPPRRARTLSSEASSPAPTALALWDAEEPPRSQA